jgi:hypothetical protein
MGTGNKSIRPTKKEITYDIEREKIQVEIRCDIEREKKSK